MIQDRNFKEWLDFFDKNKPSLTKFIFLLKKKDNYFLNHPLELDFESEIYDKVKPGGFLEKDFQEILINENPKDVYYKTRLAIAIFYGLDFEIIRNRIGENNFQDILEKILIDGHYEKYGITFEKLIAIVIKKFNFSRESLVDVAFLRGVNLGARYPTEKEDKKNKKIVIWNRLKSTFGF